MAVMSLFLIPLLAIWLFIVSSPRSKVIMALFAAAACISYSFSFDFFPTLAGMFGCLIVGSLAIIGYGKRSERLFMGRYTPEEERQRDESMERNRRHFGVP